MVTRDQALAWLNGSIGAGGLGPNPALLLKRQEAILARAGLVYAQGRQEGRVEDESESRAGPSRWSQHIEAPVEDPWTLSSDTDGTQPESIGPPDQVQQRLNDSTQEDFPLPPSSPPDDRSSSRQQARPAVRTQTQNVTSEYSSSRRNTPAQASTAGTEHRLLAFMLQQETQDLTDPSFSMSPQKPAQQLPTAISAGSAIASSPRMDPPPPPAMINKKGRVVKFDMPPVRMSDRSGFSAATNVTTPADTGTVAAPPYSKARSTIKTLREELIVKISPPTKAGASTSRAKEGPETTSTTLQKRTTTRMLLCTLLRRSKCMRIIMQRQADRLPVERVQTIQPPCPP
ncbi:unnamed protein product [Tilletia controversa]|nr:unnamed protein product [Tilletia controversa]